MTLGNATQIPLRPIDLCVATLSVFQKREFKGKNKSNKNTIELSRTNKNNTNWQ
jgi:hypothetical protein